MILKNHIKLLWHNLEFCSGWTLARQWTTFSCNSAACQRASTRSDNTPPRFRRGRRASPAYRWPPTAQSVPRTHRPASPCPPVRYALPRSRTTPDSSLLADMLSINLQCSWVYWRLTRSLVHRLELIVAHDLQHLDQIAATNPFRFALESRANDQQNGEQTNCEGCHCRVCLDWWLCVVRAANWYCVECVASWTSYTMRYQLNNKHKLW